MRTLCAMGKAPSALAGAAGDAAANIPPGAIQERIHPSRCWEADAPPPRSLVVDQELFEDEHQVPLEGGWVGARLLPSGELKNVLCDPEPVHLGKVLEQACREGSRDDPRSWAGNTCSKAHSAHEDV